MTVGYLLNTERGQEGEPGPFYNYILAGNGLFVRAKSPFLQATVMIAYAPVRGLLPLEETVELPMGSIPRYIYNLALSIFFSNRRQEHYVAVTWEGEYRLRVPFQEPGECGVRYERLPSTVLDIHSHGTMRPFFSGTDDRDEQGFRLYMVVGRLDTLVPEVEMRVGVYGYFAPVQFEEVFG
jgi:PRTRC genetic system protein A